MGKEYKYNAFISYRHSDQDSLIAASLHELLEKFVLPQNMRARKSENGIRRVFRDVEELPTSNCLSDVIEDALRESEHFILICSPRYQESPWCLKELESFMEMHGSENIHPVLVEGEPQECIPEIVREYNLPVVDIRCKDSIHIKRVLKEKYLELVAPVMGVNIEELREEVKEDKNKKIAKLSFLIAGISVLFGIFSVISAMEISSQKKELARHQSVSLAESSAQALSEDDRLKALDLAYQSLTESEGTQMEYTPEGQEALFNAVMPYNVSIPYYAVGTATVSSGIEKAITNKESPTICFETQVGEIALINVKKKYVIYSAYRANDLQENEKDIIGLSADGTLRYMDGGDFITIEGNHGDEYNRQENMEGKIYDLYYGHSEKVVPIEAQYENEADTLHIYDQDKYITVDYLPSSDVIFSSDDEYIAYEYTEETGKKGIYIVDISHAYEICADFPVGNVNLVDAQFDNENVYFLFDVMDESGEGKTGIQVMTYDLENKDVIWKYDSLDTFGRKLGLVIHDKAFWIVAACENSILVLGQNDSGSYLERNVTLSNDYIGYIDSDDNNAFRIIDADGNEYGIATDGNGNCIIDTRLFININNEKIDFIYYVAEQDTFVATASNSNKIIFYGENQGREVSKYQEDINVDSFINREKNYQDMAQSLGLEDPDNVVCLVVFGNADMACVGYRYGNKEIIELSTGRICDTWFSDNIFFGALGPDKYGNYYLIETDETESLLLDDRIISSDKKIVGSFTGLAGLTEEGDEVILGSVFNEQVYCAPVYSYGDLVKLARKDRVKYE